jgi:hypothetical protein
MGKSAYAAWMLIWLGCLLGLGIRVESAALEVPIVNLYRGEINGTRFSAMTVNIMRNLFGPPSAIEEPESRQDGQGAHIQYHALGLSFAMPHPRDQAPLHKPCHHFLYSGGAFARLYPVNPSPARNHAAKPKRRPRGRGRFALDIWWLVSVPYSRLKAPRM